MAKINVYARTNKKDPAGSVPLMIVVRHKNQRAMLTLGFRVPAKDWNERRSEVRKTCPEHVHYNRRISEVLAVGRDQLARFVTSGKSFRAADVRDAVRAELGGGHQKSDKGFLEYADGLLKGYMDRGQIATYRAYRTTVKKLRNFTRQSTGRTRLEFGEITSAFVRGFQTYMVADLGNKTNTVHKCMTSFRTMLYFAIKDGLFPQSENPFFQIRLKKEKAQKEKLSLEEMRIIEDLELEPGSLIWDVQQWFLFAFYAGGMRFSDVAKLRREYVREVESPDGGVEYKVFYRMKKTKDVHPVLLVDQAVKIMDRYGFQEKGPGDLVFPILAGVDISSELKLHNAIGSKNALVNKYVKKIQKRASIETRLSFHLSRHSIAFYLKDKGYDIYTIRDILGHSSVTVTEHYLSGFMDSSTDEAMRSLAGS